MGIGTNNRLPSFRSQKKKTEDFLLCLFWLVPSPRHFAKLNANSYCNGLTDSVQVEVVSDAVL
jgi:hypothetical protein